MSGRILRVIVIIFLGTGCFLMGYYNEAICTFFFNKDAMIGLLSVALMGSIFYSQHLKGRLTYYRHQNEITIDKLEAANSRYWNRKELKVLINERFKDFVGVLKSRSDDLHKSISLRDDIMKEIKSDLMTKISNLKNDVIIEIQKTKTK